MMISHWLSAGRPARPDLSRRRKVVPGLESLEPLMLLAAGTPAISGAVFFDQGSGQASATNNGLFDPGEKGVGGASVQLFDANHNVVGTTTTAADGSYAFVSTNGLPPNPSPPTVTTPTQTLSLGDVSKDQIPTNFATKALAPPLNLFDPRLGTLTAVTVQTSVSFKSITTSQNLSPSGPATITPSLQGAYDLEGLNQPIRGTVNAPSSSMTVPAFDPANPSASTAVFPPVSATDMPTEQTLTDPSSLAFFTATSGRSTISPTLSATSSGNGTEPNGNLTTTVKSSAAATVTVSYTYATTNNILKPGTYTVVQAPAVPGLIAGKESQNNSTVFPSNGSAQTLTVQLTTNDSPANDFAKLTVPPLPPTVASLYRRGVHMQPTTLLLAFNGTVDAARAQDGRNYAVLTPDGRRIAIASAGYDPTTKTVALMTAQRLNAHARFDLSVKLPGTDSQPTVTVPFGGKPTLIGYYDSQGNFVPISNGVVGKSTATPRTRLR